MRSGLGQVDRNTLCKYIKRIDQLFISWEFIISIFFGAYLLRIVHSRLKKLYICDFIYLFFLIGAWGENSAPYLLNHGKDQLEHHIMIKFYSISNACSNPTVFQMLVYQNSKCRHRLLTPSYIMIIRSTSIFLPFASNLKNKNLYQTYWEKLHTVDFPKGLTL